MNEVRGLAAIQILTVFEQCLLWGAGLINVLMNTSSQCGCQNLNAPTDA